MAGNFMLATILCLALASAVSAQVMEGNYNVTQVCTMVKTGTQVGSILSCDYYYACTSSGPVKKLCSAGYAYNYKTQNCAPASQVECYYGVENPCVGKTGTNWVPNVNNCQGWIYCVGEKASSSGTCAKGEIFDGTNQKCIYGSCPSTDGVGPATLNYCSVVPPNIYFGSTSNCKSWYYCSPQGSISTGECKSSAFIVSTGVCGYDTAPGACDRVVSLPVPTTCTTKGQTAGDPNVCGNFYVCDGSIYVLNQCPLGTYYDTVKKSCVNRKSASPTAGCNRCQYANSPFVNAVNYGNCNTYYYCTNGRNGDTSTCSTGSYFNENDQACAPVSGLPNYTKDNGACAGATAGTTVNPNTGTTPSGSTDGSTDKSTEGSTDSSTDKSTSENPDNTG